MVAGKTVAKVGNKNLRVASVLAGKDREVSRQPGGETRGRSGTVDEDLFHDLEYLGVMMLSTLSRSSSRVGCQTVREDAFCNQSCTAASSLFTVIEARNAPNDMEEYLFL